MIGTAWPVVLELQPMMHLERIDGRTVAVMAVLPACRPPGPLVTEWEFGRPLTTQSDPARSGGIHEKRALGAHS
jgi:hypothetical protein